MEKRLQTRAEEIANSVSHGLGLLLALIATPILLSVTYEKGSLINMVAASIYMASLVLMFFSSTLYHCMMPSRAKQGVRLLDHAAIYILIAGTYTPFTLGILKGAWGWSLLVVIWTIALAGLLLMFGGKLKRPWLSNALYLAMGWLVVVAIVPLVQRMPLNGLLWLLAGGLAYSLGVIFYAKDSQLRYGHALWHLFVLAGTSCHFFAVLWYAV